VDVEGVFDRVLHLDDEEAPADNHWRWDQHT
jgi:hypothetical protein